MLYTHPYSFNKMRTNIKFLKAPKDCGLIGLLDFESTFTINNSRKTHHLPYINVLQYGICASDDICTSQVVHRGIKHCGNAARIITYKDQHKDEEPLRNFEVVSKVYK